MNYQNSHYDCVIIGGGMVGLSLANQLLEKKITNSIVIIDKEETLGCHSSGKNSGVIHAGIYYAPGSTKARVCINGGKRLKNWARERDIPINRCGKIIVPTKATLDKQIDVLKERSEKNGATVEVINKEDLMKIAPYVSSASGRALWSPNTAVVKPLLVVERLQKELIQKKVVILKGQKNWTVNLQTRCLDLYDGNKINYAHLFNCGGLQADQIAHLFDVGRDYFLMPFKGIYWQLKKKSKIQPKTNIYPVPDLSVPFLGVHFTPSASREGLVSIGPTANLAMGRENYSNLNKIEPMMAAQNLGILARQYLLNQGNIRRYVHEQAFLNIPNLLLKAARELIPEIGENDIELSNKVAIRPQLFNREKDKLEDDFLCLDGPSSTHVLNAISPAFTASFELADLILERSTYIKN